VNFLLQFMVIKSLDPDPDRYSAKILGPNQWIRIRYTSGKWIFF